MNHHHLHLLVDGAGHPHLTSVFPQSYLPQKDHSHAAGKMPLSPVPVTLMGSESSPIPTELGSPAMPPLSSAFKGPHLSALSSPKSEFLVDVRAVPLREARSVPWALAR